jgi:hypothetical protein
MHIKFQQIQLTRKLKYMYTKSLQRNMIWNVIKTNPSMSIQACNQAMFSVCIM